MPKTTKVKELSSNQRNALFGGFTPEVEILNGRLAMIGFLAIVLIEVFSSHGFLHFWDIL